MALSLSDLKKTKGQPKQQNKQLPSKERKMLRPWQELPSSSLKPETEAKVEPKLNYGSVYKPLAVDENSTETGNKLTTNRQQTGNDSAVSQEQTGNKLTTKQQQSGNNFILEKVPSDETGNKLTTEPATLSATKWQQTDNKVATNLPFSSLIGLQRAIMILLYDACKSARGRETEPLTLEHISTCLNTSSGSVKTTLQRLEEKGCVVRTSFKNGRGGWSKYELPEAIFREMLQFETENKLTTKWQQTDNKVATQPTTEPATSASSSSSFIDLKNLKTTTTEEPELIKSDSTMLSPEWLAVDISPLEGLGFSQNHLVQIIRQNLLKPEVVQNSIFAFAFDLKINGKAKTISGPPINFFMGILRKGIPYAAPDNYATPEQQAIERYVQGQQRIVARDKALREQLQEAEFLSWVETLNTDEKKKLAEGYAENSPIWRGKLRNHFDEVVWPAKEKEILGKILNVPKDNQMGTDNAPLVPLS